MTADITAAIDSIRSRLPPEYHYPRVGIVCGSGLSELGDSIQDVHIIHYKTIPGFGTSTGNSKSHRIYLGLSVELLSTVAGHRSELAIGFLGKNKVPVVAMLGRFHYYEGHPLSTVVYPIRVMASLGVKEVIITNAAGSLNPDIPVGTIVVIRDHLALPNLVGTNPLFGRQRFLPLSDAYSPKLRRFAFQALYDLSFESSAMQEGTYAWVGGPTYETPAEGRFLRDAGADVVGMSTVPEVVVAKDEGMEVLVLTLVTNFVVIPPSYWSIKEEVEAELAGKPIAPPPSQVVSHEEVLTVGQQRAQVMKKLVKGVVERLY